MNDHTHGPTPADPRSATTNVPASSTPPPSTPPPSTPPPSTPPPPGGPSEPLAPAATAGAGEPDRRGRRIGWQGLLAATLAGTVGAGMVVAPAALLDDDASPTAVTDLTATPTSDGQTSVAAVARELGPSVARVDAVGPRGSGAGSAVVYDREGILVTNAHVVDGAEEVTITLPDGGEHEAEVVGSDARSDLAVLRVDAELPVPQWADADDRDPDATAEGADVATDQGRDVVVGDQVVAIGSPFGLDGTVTSGIVSAVGRTVPSGQGATLFDLLQTDAAINPGNSGGALVDASGRVIGINTAIVSSSGGNDGVGFAIPASTVHSVAGQLLTTGSVEHAELGIVGQAIDADVAELYGLAVERGALISEVREDGPADQAGVQRGDIVVELDGEPITSITDLVAEIQQRRPGDTIDLTVVRDGEERLLTAELAERE